MPEGLVPLPRCKPMNEMNCQFQLRATFGKHPSSQLISQCYRILIQEVSDQRLVQWIQRKNRQQTIELVQTFYLYHVTCVASTFYTSIWGVFANNFIWLALALLGTEVCYLVRCSSGGFVSAFNSGDSRKKADVGASSSSSSSVKLIV